MARHMPGHQPLAPARRPVVRHLRVLVQAGPDAVADELAHHRVAVRLGVLLHGVADVAHALAGMALRDPGVQRLLASPASAAAPRRSPGPPPPCARRRRRSRPRCSRGRGRRCRPPSASACPGCRARPPRSPRCTASPGSRGSRGRRAWRPPSRCDSRAMRSSSFVVTPGTAASASSLSVSTTMRAGPVHLLQLGPGLLDAHAPPRRSDDAAAASREDRRPRGR